MLLSVTLLLLYNNRMKNDFFALFLVFFATDTCSFANTHSMTGVVPFQTDRRVLYNCSTSS